VTQPLFGASDESQDECKATNEGSAGLNERVDGGSVLYGHLPKWPGKGGWGIVRAQYLGQQPLIVGYCACTYSGPQPQTPCAGGHWIQPTRPFLVLKKNPPLQ
jgi:hypothetical protein